MSRMPERDTLAFPFAIEATGARRCGRAEHIRQRIEQVLFTAPGERIYRPEFGFGARRLVFAAPDSLLRETAGQQLSASLAEALRGEVDPATLEVDLHSDDARLIIEIRYRLAAIDRQERQTFVVGEAWHG